jgi:hypothetical protein
MGKKKQRIVSERTQAPRAPVKRQKIKLRSLLPWILAAIVITLISFFPILKNGFTNWDDEFYVVNNRMLQGPDWNAIFTQPVAANYHPLTMISLAINYQISGLHPFSYIFTNLMIHLLNTVLVFYLIYRISYQQMAVSLLTALIFGVHPMHIESVAWISERKDVLYTFFFLLALIKYWSYLQSGSRSGYWICLLWFVLSLLSKPAAVVFPLVLFLFDYWKGRSLNKKIIVEKIPFFLLAIIFAIITWQVQSSKAMADLNVFPLWTRLFFASYGIMIYFIRFFIPYPLSSFHPFPSADHLGWPVLISPIFMLALLLLLWLLRKNKVIVFGILFYIVNLLLVLQIVSVGLTIVSERYTYVPYIGLAFTAGMLLSRVKIVAEKKLLWVVSVFAAVIFGTITFLHSSVWQNSGALWSHVIFHYPNSPYARTNRAQYLIPLAQSMTDPAKKDSLLNLALEDCSVTLKNDHRHVPGYQNRINIYLLRNQTTEALADADSLIKYDANNPAGYLTKGIVYSRLNDSENAFANLNKTIALNPNSDMALSLRGTLFVNNYQKFAEALSDFNKAIQLNPKGEYFLNRSICYYRLGNMEKAKADAQTALQKGTVVPQNYRSLLNL